MSKIIYKILLSGIAILLLINCQHNGPKQNFGTFAGIAGGAALGSQFGDGMTGAILGGVAGGLLGSYVGQKMDEDDQIRHQASAQKALEDAPDNKIVAWRNPNNGHKGYVKPTKTYQKASGRYCREYIQVVEINGQKQKAYGNACRQPDGAWQIIK